MLKMKTKPYRILLIDDDIDLLELSERILKKLGYYVIPYTSSLQALELFRDLPSQFDLVITDFRMPGMNGAELSREILKVAPEIPIIMCSGYSSDFGEEDAQSIGIRWFARKPLLTQDFAILVETALGSG